MRDPISVIPKALTVGLGALAFLVTGAAAQAQEKPQNIVVIMTDDVGWGAWGATPAASIN